MTNGWLSNRPINPLMEEETRNLLVKLSHSPEGEVLSQWLEFRAMSLHQQILEDNQPLEDHKLNRDIGRLQEIENMVRMLNKCKNNAD